MISAQIQPMCACVSARTHVLIGFLLHPTRAATFPTLAHGLMRILFWDRCRVRTVMSAYLSSEMPREAASSSSIDGGPVRSPWTRSVTRAPSSCNPSSGFLCNAGFRQISLRICGRIDSFSTALKNQPAHQGCGQDAVS